jgi:hypothetical protein
VDRLAAGSDEVRPIARSDPASDEVRPIARSDPAYRRRKRGVIALELLERLANSPTVIALGDMLLARVGD